MTIKTLKDWGLLSLYDGDKDYFIAYARSSYLSLWATGNAFPLQSNLVDPVNLKLKWDNLVEQTIKRKDKYIDNNDPVYKSVVFIFAKHIIIDSWQSIARNP